MSETAIKDELHAIVESLDAADLSVALRVLRGVSSGDKEHRGEGILGRTGSRPETSADVGPTSHPWFDFIGIVDDDGPTVIARNHDKYLADAYMDTHDE